MRSVRAHEKVGQGRCGSRIMRAVQQDGWVVIDYFQVPDGPVAEGWPQVVANDWRLQRFVYHQTRDFMRRVSRHVSIGAAFKRERPLDHYFVLCRKA